MTVILLLLYYYQFNLVLYGSLISQHSAHHIMDSIGSWLQFSYLGNTIALNHDQILLELNDKELKQVCPYCLLVPRYPLIFKRGHFSCLPCLREYRKHRVMFEKMFTCPICKQFIRLNEIYIISSGEDKTAKLNFNENVKKCKVYLFLRRMWKVLSIWNNAPSWNVWMSSS